MILSENKFWLLIILSLAVGLTIGWIDSRPNWNDTGVTVGLIFLSSFLLSLLAEKHFWVIGIIIGICITSFNYILHNNLQSVVSFIIAFAGAYSGAGIKKLIK
jgi:hypothetical protein